MLDSIETKGRLEDSIEVYEIVGKGSYGSVFRGVHLRTRKQVAIKQVPIKEKHNLMHEIELLRECNTKYIVTFYGYFQSKDLISIVMEFCECSVADIIRKIKLQEDQIKSIARDMVSGLDYMHERSHIHRDIKAANILVSEGICKLADFGVAGRLKDGKRSTVIGTPYWMAPEVIQETGYTTKADMWSFGITCIEITLGKPPFSSIPPLKAIFEIPIAPPPQLETLDVEFRKIVNLCLSKDPKMRPTANYVLQNIKSNSNITELMKLFKRRKSEDNKKYGFKRREDSLRNLSRIN